MALLVLHWDLVGQYWIVTLLIMGSLFAGLFAFLWALLGKWRLALLLTLPILATAIVALPKPGETLFWLAGGVTYGLSGGLFMAWMAGLVVMLRRTEPMGFPWRCSLHLPCFAWRSVGWFSRELDVHVGGFSDTSRRRQLVCTAALANTAWSWGCRDCLPGSWG